MAISFIKTGAGMITIGYRHILVHDQDRVRAVREGMRQARAA
jgi:hypothetical protein